MKVKTSVSLSPDVLAALDEIDPESRSRAIEVAITDYVRRRRRAAREARDVELINQHADELNREALDVLEYQADPFAPR